jgi:hypothetical protein
MRFMRPPPRHRRRVDLSRRAGQREEHLVERRTPQAHLADRDVGLRERVDDRRQRRGTPTDAGAHEPRLRIAAHLVDRVTGEHRRRLVESPSVGDDELDALAADPGLELVGGALRDGTPVVDDEHVARELVGLLEVLRGQQQRRAAGGQLADHVPHAEPAARVEPGRRLVEEQHGRGRRRARRRGRADAACRRSSP